MVESYLRAKRTIQNVPNWSTFLNEWTREKISSAIDVIARLSTNAISVVWSSARPVMPRFTMVWGLLSTIAQK